MKMKTIAVLAIGTLVSACGDESLAPDRGDVVVAYDFDDTALLERASVFLVEGQPGLSCDDVPFGEDVVKPIARRNLPLNGEAEFTGVARGEMWMALLEGYNSAGTAIAFGCADFLQVKESELTRTSVIGRMVPLKVAGTYESQEIRFSIELPVQVQNVLLPLNAACALINGFDACDLVTGLNTAISSLDVKARWALNQSDETVTGRLDWVEVEGVPVKDGYLLTEGRIRGRVAGTDALEITSEDLSVNIDEVLRFILVEVLDTSVNQNMVSILVDYADIFTTDLDITSGDASLLDEDFDREVDFFSGEFEFSYDIDIPSIAFTHSDRDVVDWNAERVLPEPAE